MSTQSTRQSIARLVRRHWVAVALVAAATLATGSPVAAQSAGSWVDIAGGMVGSGAAASGDLQFARSQSSSKNGLGFGHGFAVGAGPNGIALSNSIGVGGGPLGAAHNVQLNIGPGGAHVSESGVVSQGGNRRVIAGGETGTVNGQVYGGSSATGFGNQTKAWSQSRTRNWNQSQPVYQTYPSGQTYSTNAVQMQSTGASATFNAPSQGISSNRSIPTQVFRVGRLSRR